jgi:trimeric autotransporter adhesin
MGKIELDHTGAGSGITLSSDGTDLLLDGTAIGGGGGTALELYAENPVTPTAPSATGDNAVAVGHGAIATGDKSISLGWSLASGIEGVAIAIDNNTTNYGAQGVNSIAMGKLAKASNTSSVAIGETSSANGIKSSALGVLAVASGTNATALTNSYASGVDSLAAAIANNTATYGATGANSVAIGDLAKATNTNAVCISNTSTASGTNSAVLGGSSGTASGSSSVALGGSSNTASGVNSTAKGYYGNTNGIRLKHATGVYPNMQGAYYVLAYATTNATPIALNTDVGTPSATNQIILPNSSAYSFSGTIVARQKASDGTASAAWEGQRSDPQGSKCCINGASQFRTDGAG